jgi:hypothetical protein
MKTPIPARDATQPPAYEPSDVAAIQALATGAATAGQQVEALRWIVEMAAGTYDLSYRVDPCATAFAEGRRFVGLNIVKLSKLRMDIVRGETPA